MNNQEQTPLAKQVDIVVIGAGPAGINAAVCATNHGASVTVLDEQPTAGGQIYRALSQVDNDRIKLLGKAYSYGGKLIEQLRQSTAIHITGATVWSVEDTGVITYSTERQAHRISAKVIIIATGALERPYPIPGWTLPGVMTVGAAQILLKSSGVIPVKPVLAGTGPLLYTVASQFIAAGVNITGIVDTVTSANTAQAARHLPVATPGPVFTGLKYLWQIKRSGIPYYKNATNLKITGDRKADGIEFQYKGKVQSLRSDCVLLHQGVIPNTQISRSLRGDHHWSALQQCFQPTLNQWGKSSAENIYIAGDGAAISGAIVAEHLGTIAALGALTQLNIISETQRDQLASAAFNAVNKLKRLRKFLDTLYQPPLQALLPDDKTIVCRCEEVTAGDIRRYAGLGCVGPNQTKSFGRCGMGPCQGRYCGTTVTGILAAEHALSHEQVGAYRIRSPIKPVTLEELASLHQ
jgi:NADPH-dependent 2,4-dienoyl-CoA reductase/sulfur reductase-like enzyme